MYVISHIGGTCGDLITAIIDSTDADISYNATVILDDTRIALKGEARGIVDTDETLERYLAIVSRKYKSISSHSSMEIFLNMKDICLISPVVLDKEIALWASIRYTKVSRAKPYNFALGKYCETDEEYADILLNHSKLINNSTIKPPLILIDVRDIVEGNLITKLKNNINIELDNDFYQKWLSLDRNRL